MDEQKKQKVLLGVLAVLALGAGSYYFVTRESEAASRAAKSTGPTVRRERKARTTKANTRKKREKKDRSAEAKGASRRERVAKKGSKSSGRRKKGRKKGKEKKRTSAPAA